MTIVPIVVAEVTLVALSSQWLGESRGPRRQSCLVRVVS
jgi:hypothetical protein